MRDGSSATEPQRQGLMTMASDHLDEILDARQEIRKLKKRVTGARRAWDEAKAELAACEGSLEALYVEIEERKGRRKGDAG
jgi:hypothetical protein